jgi:predicted regulator of Ras-like GTPase activity (Roadblock/LC7/MglB family)
MEDILKSINSISGVLGSFICDSKGKILAFSMPGSIDKSMLLNVSRTVTQTISGLATTHRRKIEDLDLVFDQGRFISKNIGESHLCILCVRSINVPLLNMTTNLAVKKLAKMLVEYKVKDVKEAKIQEEWKSNSQWLNTEAQNIVSAARSRGLILQASGDAAIRLRCPGAGRLALTLEERVLDLVCREKQVVQISQLIEELGFLPERNFNMLHGSQRLRFTSQEKKLGLEIFLDLLNMYHQLIFSDRLHLGDDTLPLADLLLWKLQNVELDEETTKAVIAIINDHELGGPGESEKIETKRIVGLCSTDWGWFKTVTMNLDKSISWAENHPEVPVTVFLERARSLTKMIKDSSKSGGWQLRARIGESMRWYQLPE